MLARTLLLIVLTGAMTAAPALAADPGKPPRRGGMALAVELGTGGDKLDSVSDSEVRAGEGLTVLLGGFYRPIEHSPLEIYGFAGYDFGVIVPVQGGGGSYAYLQSPVVEVLANYRFDNKWHVAGGLVSHLNPRLDNNSSTYEDIDFHTATGVTVEAGWSFIGLYYTYTRYESARLDLDGSSVGIRFNIRFRKWRPVH